MKSRKSLVLLASAACSALMTGAISAGPAAAAGSAGSPAAMARLGLAQPIPGLAGLNVGCSARVNKVSCASAGNCAAVGLYQEANHHDQVFAAFEKGGTWQKAAPIPD